MVKLHSRSVVILIVSILAAVLITALALPALAASPKGGKHGPGPGPGPGPGANPIDQNGPHIQGTATGSIVLTASDSTIITLSMPTDKVDATYNLTDTTYTLKSLRVVCPAPTPGATPTAMAGTHVQGTDSGSILLTPSSGTAVTLTMPADTLEACYSVSGTVNTLISLMVVNSKPAPNDNPPGKNGTHIQGIASGSLTITPTSGSAVTLSFPAGTIDAEYSVSGTTNTLKSLRLFAAPPTPGATPTLPTGTHIQGIASGSLTITPTSGSAIILALPVDTVEAFYSISGATNTLMDLKVWMAKPSPCTPTTTPTKTVTTSQKGKPKGK